MGRRAVIAGASGLVGQSLLQLLLESPEIDAVVSLGRRKLGLASPKLGEQILDFADAAALAGALAEARGDDVFCCLGTTIKKAGSQAAFRAVDHDAPLALAKAALGAGAQQFLVCTAVGADAHSRVFYSRVKGELEEALRGLAFPRGVKIVHPSMILGDRQERRPLESMLGLPMKWSSPIFKGPLWRYRPIAAERVARALFNAALREPPGDRCYEGKPLFRLAGFA